MGSQRQPPFLFQDLCLPPQPTSSHVCTNHRAWTRESLPIVRTKIQKYKMVLVIFWVVCAIGPCTTRSRHRSSRQPECPVTLPSPRPPYRTEGLALLVPLDRPEDVYDCQCRVSPGPFCHDVTRHGGRTGASPVCAVGVRRRRCPLKVVPVAGSVGVGVSPFPLLCRAVLRSCVGRVRCRKLFL